MGSRLDYFIRENIINSFVLRRKKNDCDPILGTYKSTSDPPQKKFTWYIINQYMRLLSIGYRTGEDEKYRYFSLCNLCVFIAF